MQAAARQPITAEARQYMRQYLDREKRKALAAAKGADLGTCKQCGCDLATYATGCRACSNRRFNRQRQTDPDYRRQQAAKSRERRTRAKANAYAKACSTVER